MIPKQKPKEKKEEKKRTLKLVNPYSTILQSWPNTQAVKQVMLAGPDMIKKWQQSQISELQIPHISPTHLAGLANALNIPLSLFFKELHSALLNEFLHLIQQCESTSKKDRDKLIRILHNSFRFIRVPEFQSINIEILKRLNPLPTNVLRTLKDPKNHDVLNLMPDLIRRQVWIAYHDLFKKQIKKHIDGYIENMDETVYGCNLFESINIRIEKFNKRKKRKEERKRKKKNNNNIRNKYRRRNNIHLKKIVDFIGSSNELFQVCIDHIRYEYFLKLRSLRSRWRLHKQRSKEQRIEICLQYHSDFKRIFGYAHLRYELSLILFDYALKQLVNEIDQCWCLISLLDSIMDDLSKSIQNQYPNIHPKSIRINSTHIESIRDYCLSNLNRFKIKKKRKEEEEEEEAKAKTKEEEGNKIKKKKKGKNSYLE